MKGITIRQKSKKTSVSNDKRLEYKFLGEKHVFCQNLPLRGTFDNYDYKVKICRLKAFGMSQYSPKNPNLTEVSFF